MKKRFNVRGMIDNARREKKIGKLLSTLKVMDEAQAAQLLKRLAPRLKEGAPELFAQLERHLRNPEQVFEKLSVEEGRRLWGRLKLDEREAVASRLSKDTIAVFDLPLPKDEGAPRKIDPEEYQQSIDSFHTQLENEQNQGNIGRFSLLLNSVRSQPCYRLDKVFEARVRLVPNDPLIPLDESMQIMIFREKYSGGSCQIRLSKMLNERQITLGGGAVNFDSSGFAHWRSEPLKECGIFEIAAIGGEGQLLNRCTVGVARPSEKTFALDMEALHWEEEDGDVQMTVRGTLIHGRMPVTTDLQIQTYCGCGNLIDEQWAHYEKGQGEMELFMGRHQGPFYVRYSTTKSGVLGAFMTDLPAEITPFGSKTRISAPQSAKPGEAIPVTLEAVSASERLEGILIGSDCVGFTDHLTQAFLRPLGKVSHGDGQFARFNTAVDNGGLPFDFGFDLAMSKVHLIDTVGGVNTSFTFPWIGHPEAWNIYFFERVLDGFAMLEKRVEAGDTIIADFPAYVLPGDTVEGMIRYKVRAEHQLTVIQGNRESQFVLNHSGSLPIPLRHGAVVEMKAVNGGGPEWTHRWESVLPSYDFFKFHVLSQGQSVKIRKGHLYPDLRFWVLDVALALMTYPCRCGEQTSAIIGGLLMLRHLAKNGLTHPDFDAAKIDGLLGMEAERLASMQNGNGHLNLWPHEEISNGSSVVDELDVIALFNIRGLETLETEKGKEVVAHLKQWIQGNRRSLPPFPQELLTHPQRQKAIRDGANGGGANGGGANGGGGHAGASAGQPREEALDWVKRHLVRQEDCLTAQSQGSFCGRDYFPAIALEYLTLLGFPDIEYISKLGLRWKRKHGWFARLTAAFGLRELGAASGRHADQFASSNDPDDLIDPARAVLRGFAANQFAGYWGTTPTVRIMTSLMRMAAVRPFAGSFQIEGEESAVTPTTKLAVENKTVTLVSEEGIAVGDQKMDFMEIWEDIDNDALPKTDLDVSFAPGDKRLTLGKSYRLTVSFKCKDIPNPEMRLAHSGQIHFEGFERDADLNSDLLYFTIGTKRTFTIRPVRRGNSRLKGYVSDMFHGDRRFRFEVPLEVI